MSITDSATASTPAAITRDLIGGNFVMIHLDLVDALGGSWEAAALLARIDYRAGSDGWWTVTKEELAADMHVTPARLRRAIEECRAVGAIESERVSTFDSTLRWRCIFAGQPESADLAFPESADLTLSQSADLALSQSADLALSLCSKNVEEQTQEHPPPPTGEETGLLLDFPINFTPPAVVAGFDQFWALYPRKVGKDAAKRAYDRAVKRASHAAILDGLVCQLGAFAMSKKPDGDFRPHPATWLNRGGWDDVPDDVAVPHQSPGRQNLFAVQAQKDASAGLLDDYLGIDTTPRLGELQ